MKNFECELYFNIENEHEINAEHIDLHIKLVAKLANLNKGSFLYNLCIEST